MIGIVDYGLGNVQAFANIYRRLGIVAQPVRTAAELEMADRLILPGVGAFDWAMARLTESGMLTTLNRRVIEDRVPVLGVCVGMQIMARRSEEGVSAGLGWIAAEVRRLTLPNESGGQIQLPHMGWNDVEPVRPCILFDGIDLPRYYFLHSYYFVPDSDDVVLGRTVYGAEFASAVRQNNIFATQFHPEKSHEWGVRLLKNFSNTPLCYAPA